MNRTRNRRGTERIARSRVRAVLKIFGLVAAALLASSGLADAAQVELKAKVVWVRGERVYVASAESLEVEEGDLLRFRVRGKEIAAGKVVDVRDAAMIVGSLTSGSFRKQKKLEKVRIFAERPPLLPLRLLRIGCPSPSRPCLLFACEHGTIGGSLPAGAYRADTLSQRSYRFVRDSTVALVAPWPDTLLIRAFDESADEEIALERGELDVTVFWPGELSTHIREDARWSGHLYGIRSRGSLFAAGSLDAGSAREAIRLLNRALFGGDLAPWNTRADGGGAGDTSVPPRPTSDVRMEVDRSIPAFAAIERALDQGPNSSATRRTVRIFYSSARTAPEDAATLLSAIRCPVVSSPRLHRTIYALGPDAFADLLGCGGNDERAR